MTTAATCDVCGNEYHTPLSISQGDRVGVFDSFECAAQAMAPVCAHCGCRILGHGVEQEASVYCCANCARHGAENGVRSRR
ncbi:hypothetical protein [Brachybacterium sp. YJGR34]|uniref:hypothetical protein n=1 Tax=Brachybacterium sp. YJGR34 TaxID=2059911 RepID=UPI000E09F04C|nr:hypothetical protein [Brachybacterium sp. YJGR34]